MSSYIVESAASRKSSVESAFSTQMDVKIAAASSEQERL